jgi:hypothetical protein
MATVSTEIPRKWRKFDEIVAVEFAETLRRGAEGFYRSLGRHFEREDINASGETWKSIRIGELKRTGSRMSIEVGPTGDRAKVVAFIEFGRKPGNAAPVDAIKEWLYERKIVTPGDDPEKVHAIAWYIAKNIGQYGIEPRPIFERTERQYTPHLIRMMEAAARRVVKRINGI